MAAPLVPQLHLGESLTRKSGRPGGRPRTRGSAPPNPFGSLDRRQVLQLCCGGALEL